MVKKYKIKAEEYYAEYDTEVKGITYLISKQREYYSGKNYFVDCLRAKELNWLIERARCNDALSEKEKGKLINKYENPGNFKSCLIIEYDYYKKKARFLFDITSCETKENNILDHTAYYSTYKMDEVFDLLCHVYNLDNPLCIYLFEEA